MSIWKSLLRLSMAFLACGWAEGLSAKAPDYDPPTGTRGWCTYVGPGTEECFGSPGAACYRQYEVYGPPYGAPGPYLGYYDTENWRVKHCDWVWAASPAPISVLFQCDYTHIPTAGRCGLQDPQECADPCSTNNGSVQNPRTPAPINLLSGSKVYAARDYANASETLAVNRWPERGIQCRTLELPLFWSRGRNTWWSVQRRKCFAYLPGL